MPRRLQPKVPHDLETICQKCLHKRPDQRNWSAAELAEDWSRFLATQPIHARPIRLWKRGQTRARRHSALALLVLVSETALAGVVGSSVFCQSRLRAVGIR